VSKDWGTPGKPTTSTDPKVGNWWEIEMVSPISVAREVVQANNEAMRINAGRILFFMKE
jgi:hypothetical protein